MEKHYRVELTDFQDLHDFLLKLYAYEIILFEENCEDFPFHVDILSRSHYKGTKQYILQVNNLLVS